MTDVVISVEDLNIGVLDAYAASGMERGKAGHKAIKWAFDGNKAAFSVARSAGKVVGLSSYIQSRMKFGTQKGSGFQAVDSFVTPDFRGLGLFTRLAENYAEHSKKNAADLIWGFPNDNAAPAWFGKLAWANHQQVPFLIKPLRAGYFLRKLRLGGDFPLSTSKDQNLDPVEAFDEWTDDLWDNYARDISCSTIRDRCFLTHRLLNAPQADQYRVVAERSSNGGAIVATRQAEKHGGHIAYLMEAMGTDLLRGVLTSELSRLRDQGAELALAWAYPWSPNYYTLRQCGFIPLPDKLRPIRIWFGGKEMSHKAECALRRASWYLSYLDSDTI